jgi:ArsR family transcriptional regulator
MIEAEQTRRAELLKAVAHPTRIAILEILRPGEECVCRICPALEGSQPNTSKHLGVLKKAGILESRQEGTMTFYRVVDTRVYEILDLADQMLKRRSRGRAA